MKFNVMVGADFDVCSHTKMKLSSSFVNSLDSFMDEINIEH